MGDSHRSRVCTDTNLVPALERVSVAVAAEHKADRRFSQHCPRATGAALAVPLAHGAARGLACAWSTGGLLSLHFATSRFCSVTQITRESPAIMAVWGGSSTELSVGVVVFAHLQLPGQLSQLGGQAAPLFQRGSFSVPLTRVGLSRCNPG